MFESLQVYFDHFISNLHEYPKIPNFLNYIHIIYENVGNFHTVLRIIWPSSADRLIIIDS